MNNNIRNVILEELERRTIYRNLHRTLRDESDPFNMPEESFRKMYRLDIEGAMYVFACIENQLESQRKSGIPPVIKFLTALHFLGHGSYQKSVGKDLHVGLSQASVSRCLHIVVDALIENLSGKISFPTTNNEIINVKAGFFERFAMPGVLGCIDCTHIAIVPPPAELYGPRPVFMNRKGFFSINCQLICDSNLNIIGVNARYPGSVHDSAIWQMSTIKAHLLRNFRNGERNSWLLGDSGYPLQPFLLTPILGANPETPEGQYTRRHCLIRNSVERCIGLLKGYFRCLRTDRVLHYDPLFAAKIINACCILHNIMRERNLHQENYINENVEYVVFDENMHVEDNENDLFDIGRVTRRNLIKQLF